MHKLCISSLFLFVCEDDNNFLTLSIQASHVAHNYLMWSEKLDIKIHLPRIRCQLANVTSQVDRCNSLLVRAPKRLLDCLQSVLNVAASLVCNRRKYDHITPLLRDVLHWLPVPLRVEFKICLL